MSSKSEKSVSNQDQDSNKNTSNLDSSIGAPSTESAQSETQQPQQAEQSATTSKPEIVVSANDFDDQSNLEVERIDEQGEIISKIEDLLGYLTSYYSNTANDDNVSLTSLNNPSVAMETSTIIASSEANLSQQQVGPSSSVQQKIAQQFNYTYTEMLAMYEREKTLRIDMETTYNQKAKESNKQVRRVGWFLGLNGVVWCFD